MDITTRSEAIRLGLAHYYTGKPCKHGHLSLRRVVGGICLSCHSHKKENGYFQEAGKKFRDLNPDYAKEYRTKQKTKDSNNTPTTGEQRLLNCKKKQKEWRQNNKARVRDKNKEWRDSNAERLLTATIIRTYRIALATPKWVNVDDIIRLHLSKTEDQQLDHGIPLAHDLVCGLHVPCNLDLVPANKNRAKYNHFDPDEWSYSEAESRFVRTILPSAPDYDED